MPRPRPLRHTALEPATPGSARSDDSNFEALLLLRGCPGKSVGMVVEDDLRMTIGGRSNLYIDPELQMMSWYVTRSISSKL